MDIAGMWRGMPAGHAEVPRPGAHQETGGITISVTQQCQVALPLSGFIADEITVTVTSHRPGAAAQVRIGANFNSSDGSYQGPTTAVGQGQFTATSSHVDAGLVVLPSAEGTVLGVGAEASWADGEPPSVALTYELLVECNTRVPWRWLIRILAVLTRRFSAWSSRMPPLSSGG